MSTPHYIDITVKGMTAAGTLNPWFTRKAKAFNVSTQILLKVPAEKLTTVRLKGELDALKEFLSSMANTPEYNWPPAILKQHIGAIKVLVEEAPHHKNRWISEQREKNL